MASHYLPDSPMPDTRAGHLSAPTRNTPFNDDVRMLRAIQEGITRRASQKSIQDRQTTKLLHEQVPQYIEFTEVVEESHSGLSIYNHVLNQ